MGLDFKKIIIVAILILVVNWTLSVFMPTIFNFNLGTILMLIVAFALGDYFGNKKKS